MPQTPPRPASRRRWPPAARLAGLAAGWLAPLLAACAGLFIDPSVAIAPQSGPPGADVRLTAAGLPSDAAVEIGAGRRRSEYEVLERVRTTAEGRVEATLALPGHADPGDHWVFVVRTADRRAEARSEPFRVMAPRAAGDDSPRAVTVTGILTNEGIECPALRAGDGELYTLAGGGLGGFRPGDRVRVEGSVAEMSFCMQGTTLAVDRIEGAP